MRATTTHDRSAYTAQIRRLAALRGWADLEREAKTELCDALVASSHSLEHARAIIDCIITLSQYVPTPAEIRMRAEEVPDPAAATRALPTCPECAGSGWRHIWALATWRIGPDGRHVGAARLEEIPRPAHIPEATWTVRGNSIARAGDGQEVYSAVVRCRCVGGRTS